MNAEQINGLSHDQIRLWLERALKGQESLPRLSPDESHYLGILRLDRFVGPAVRSSLREGVLCLLRQFSEQGAGEVAYLQELLSLTAAFKQPESSEILADLARRFPQLPALTKDVRFAVLGALVDAPTPYPPAFWKEILQQEPEQYALLALSGVLAVDPLDEGVRLLPKMPDSKRAGQAAAIKLDLTWDALPARSRFRLVEELEKILGQCSQNFAGPVKVWAEKKNLSRPAAAHQDLLETQPRVQGEEYKPNTVDRMNRVFVVHGQDDAFRTEVLRFIEKLNLEAVILHEQASMGQTAFEKLLPISDTGYAIVLLSPDDVGARENERTHLHARARQNVVFELGYIIGRIGRDRVSAIVKGPLEIPTAAAGMVRIEYDGAGAWREGLLRELKHAGIKVDAKKAFDN